MSAIVLVIDQLSAGMLGPYGNTWIETASFNRLAAQSLLFDFAFADSMEIAGAYDRWWGTGSGEPLGNEDENPGWVSRLAIAGMESVLITDDPQIAQHRRADFDRIICVDQTPADQAAATPVDTQVAHFFAQCTAWLTGELESGCLVWLHSRGLAGDWDAPYSLRQQLAGADDPDPPRFVQPPAEWIAPESIDPDQLLGWQQSAAAQVLLIDECLGVFLDVLEASEIGRSSLLGLVSPRGCGLGEHGLVGGGGQLFSESVHVPLMLRLPGDEFSLAAARSSNLISVGVLNSIVEAWFDEDRSVLKQCLAAVDNVLPKKHAEVILISSNEQDSLQTHAWKLIRSKMGGVQLFAKPDDRCEVNDVSDRCPEVVAALIQVLDRLLVEKSANTGVDLHLPDELAMRFD
jgi:hypothetical protein